jgi:acetyl-CoA carboxylase carboxyltransferase component
MNSLLSAHGVPQIAGVLGDCIAGGGYMPIISDKLFMTEQAYMVIAGAALVKGGKSQKITSLSIGGPDVHVHLSNCADERVPDDQTMIQRIRQEVETLPASAATYYRHGFAPAEPRFAPRELNGLLAHGRGDGHGHRPHQRAVRRDHRQQPEAHAPSGAEGPDPRRRSSLP